MSEVLCNHMLRSWQSVLFPTYFSTYREFGRNKYSNGQIIDESEVESSSTNIGDSSKSVYVNDSFNLDTIPFGCEAIMEEMSDEEI